MKNILIITADNCDDSEILYPYYRMLEEGYSVDIASLEKTLIKAKYHFTIDANLSVSEVKSDDYDGLILPGGSAPEKLRLNEHVIALIKAFYDAKKPIAAICHGPQILISAGVTKDEKMTCYPGIADDIKNAEADYVNDTVVVSDNNIVTSRIPEDLPYFMREFIKLVKEG